MIGSNQRPDVDAIVSVLKDFQRDTVDYVFKRLYTDENSVRRFLVADEVGLGKTLVARGITARAVDHLWDSVDRIDVVYICSNAAIASQNINRLNFTGDQGVGFASRITLLPVHVHQLNAHRLNFISFTPQTSFSLRSSLGIAEERALLYWMLKRPWGLSGKAPLNVLQGWSYANRFRSWVRWVGDNYEIDRDLSDAFMREISHEHGVTLYESFERLCGRMPRARRPGNVPHDVRREQAELVGNLRSILAETCINAIEPDIIILDEFQRFRNLLDPDDPSGELADQLFHYSDEHSEARVILLSATPYKMYGMAHEEDENHYADFIDTIRFLEGEEHQKASLEKAIRSFRANLVAGSDSSQLDGPDPKRTLEDRLRRVMVRTERLANSVDRNAMLVESSSPPEALEMSDILDYLALQEVADAVGHHDTIHYWRSAPYLLNFMDRYKLKESVDENLEELAAGADDTPIPSRLLLSWDDVEKYRRIDPANAKMRRLLSESVEEGHWRSLWIEPSLPYYKLSKPFGSRDAPFTKQLIFSSWNVVPKVIALLTSYEVERRVLGKRAPKNTAEERRKLRPLLRFALANDRPTGMPVLSMIYPSFVLADYDPLDVALRISQDEAPTLSAIHSSIKHELEVRLGTLEDFVSDDSIDESWYWAAPLLLDLAEDADITRSWLTQRDLAKRWQGEKDSDRETRWQDHLELAASLLDGTLPLGAMPDDLGDVLAWSAIGAPGPIVLRALGRVLGWEKLRDGEIRLQAARGAYGFLSLFNRPESTALVRQEVRGGPYWQRVLRYSAAGCLQSVVDEYVHILRESMGLFDAEPAAAASAIVDGLQSATTLRTVPLGVDEIRTAVGDSGDPLRQRRTMRAHFALRFTDEKSGDGQTLIRLDQVRTAFNAPFWPFVLATTSIGQEGLDFHQYCHSVVHWNLPSNPVDLEQREGRVHRYKGHAIRKNVARQFGLGALQDAKSDPWDALFEAAERARPEGSSDISPYWVFEGDAKIERRVPLLPLSQDGERLRYLKKALASYRLVFGQARQEDLLDFLQSNLSEDELRRLVSEMVLDLSPRTSEQPLR